MHTSLRARVVLCARKDPASYSDSIDTLISLIQSNLAEILACAHKYIQCMNASLYAQGGLACFPDSIDTLISLIRPNLAEI